MATRIVYFLADDIPNSTEQAELKELNKSLQVTVMNASENAEFGENDRILPCDFVAGTIPPEYAHIPIYDISGTSGGPIYIDDVVGLPAALDAKADKPVGIEDVTGLQTELDDINTELDAAATLPIAIADVTGLQSALNSKAAKPVPISDVSGLQTELDSKAELPIAISDVTGLQEELDAVALLPINISDVTGLQTELDNKATLTQLETVVDALDAKADAPIQIQDVEGLETELDSVATLPIEISDVTGLQAALDSAGSLPIEISDVTGLQAALDAPVPISDVTGLQTALDSKAALTDLDPIIADLATKQDAPVAISDVTGLQAELDSVATLPIEISDVTGLQAELDSVASLPIAISDVTGLQAELDAPTLISEVTGLQTALDGKADVTDLDPILAELATKADAPVLITDVTGLQLELDSKAELPIAISDVTGLQAELDSSATLPITIADVTGLQTELDSKAELPVAIADVTGLQTELDSKADLADLNPIIASLNTKQDAPVPISAVTGLQTALDVEYVVCTASPNLANERVLTQGTNVTLTKAATTLTIAVPNAVIGPATSIDNQIARFDGITGKLIQGSASANYPTIDDTGNLSVIGNIAVSGTVDGVDVGNLGGAAFVMAPGQTSTATSNDRLLANSTGFTWVDGGANASLTLSSPDMVRNTNATAVSDNQLTRFDTATGRLIQGCPILVDDSGNISNAGTFNGNNLSATVNLANNLAVPSYITLGATTTLTNERVLTQDTGIQIADGGAGSTCKISATGNGAQVVIVAATYTPVLSDAGKTLNFNNSAGTALTVPTNATVPFPLGTELFVFQSVLPAGQVSITGVDGTVTVLVPPGRNAKTAGTNATVKLRKLDTNAWSLEDELEESVAKAPINHTHVIADVTGLQAALDSKASNTFVTNNQTTSYTLVLADATKQIDMNAADAVTLTIPLNSAVPIPVDSCIPIRQSGAGQVTVAITAPDTLVGRNGLKLAGQWAIATLSKRTATQWVLSGDTAT